MMRVSMYHIKREREIFKFKKVDKDSHACVCCDKSQKIKKTGQNYFTPQINSNPFKPRTLLTPAVKRRMRLRRGRGVGVSI